MNRRAVVMAIASAAALAGCGSASVQRYFVLEAAPARAAPASVDATLPRRTTTLLVAPTAAASFYDTQEIVYSRRPGERAYYQLASWTEPPARSFNTLLVARLENAGAFGVVAPTTSGMRGGLLLRTQLVEMFHDATTSPGHVRVVLAAEVIDPETRTRVARRTFSVTAAVRSFDAAGAVRGFDEAVGTIADDITVWVGTDPLSGR
jgi:cholesterol transport system auxiliary component